MQFSQLLGKQLKDDSVMELLEDFDVDVVYEFDRTHEGMEDLYWATFEEGGFQFRFDETQTLDVVFLYIIAGEGFTPILQSEIDVPVYESFDLAKNAFEKEGLEYVNSPGADPSDKWYQRWIKVNRGSFTTHYAFQDNQLSMITLSLIR